MVQTENGAPLTLISESNGVTILDGSKVFANGGIFSFENLEIGGTPGTENKKISISSDAVDAVYNLTVDFRECQRGEILTPD